MIILCLKSFLILWFYVSLLLPIEEYTNNHNKVLLNVCFSSKRNTCKRNTLQRFVLRNDLIWAFCPVLIKHLLTYFFMPKILLYKTVEFSEMQFLLSRSPQSQKKKYQKGKHYLKYNLITFILELCKQEEKDSNSTWGVRKVLVSTTKVSWIEKFTRWLTSWMCESTAKTEQTTCANTRKCRFVPVALLASTTRDTGWVWRISWT